MRPATAVVEIDTASHPHALRHCVVAVKRAITSSATRWSEARSSGRSASPHCTTRCSSTPRRPADLLVLAEGIRTLR